MSVDFETFIFQGVKLVRHVSMLARFLMRQGAKVEEEGFMQDEN